MQRFGCSARRSVNEANTAFFSFVIINENKTMGTAENYQDNIYCTVRIFAAVVQNPFWEFVVMAMM